MGSDRADREALRDLRSRCFLVRRQSRSPRSGAYTAHDFGRRHARRACRAQLACLLHFRQRAALTARTGRASLGNNKGTHHETSEDSGYARPARRGGSGAGRSVIHLDSHERLRLPRCFAVGEGSRGPGEHRFGHESGWYVGAWASNVDFGDDVDIDYEVDLYTGFSGGDEEGLGWDVGFVYYAYPDESDANYPEIYGKLSYGMFSGALFYSNDYVNSGGKRDVCLGRRERAGCGQRFLGHWRTPATASATSGTAKTASRARTTSTSRSAWATRSATSTWR